ncbi:MAG: hypothetical protein CMI95_05885 [Pelagibacteraceae bacterium]|nr:hypothetical protein [Pelagibacteraceae bacterium]PPR51596.1 MAG: hypothetical protein CFH20_00526 [Alphaproteobacteria bacterium MarineAlpha5_Bin10]|tara:strand:+ start:4235 stop:5017 length:783 start_codon:yes stop_codon:yes gene_type:complete
MKNKKFNFVNKKPFYVFHIPDFLENDLYMRLSKEFPQFDENKFNKLGDGKFSFYAKGEHYESLLTKNPSMQEFHKIVFDKKFFSFFYKSLFSKILFSQRNNFIRFFKYLRPSVRHNKDNFFDFLFSKIKIELTYSYIKNNGEIVPHTDNVNKFLNLMLYFPDFETNNDNIENSKKEELYGTQFWSSKEKFTASEQSIDDYNSSNKSVFRNRNQKLYRTPFVGNRLYGFIRNDYSWHSVEPINISSNYIRKSINIKFIYVN